MRAKHDTPSPHIGYRVLATRKAAAPPGTNFLDDFPSKTTGAHEKGGIWEDLAEISAQTHRSAFRAVLIHCRGGKKKRRGDVCFVILRVVR